MYNRNFCVYEYWRLDNNTCFYVGKGTHKRAKNTTKRNNHFKNILNKTECAMVIVADNLTEEEAHQTECYLIHSYVFEEGYGIGCKGHEKKSGTPYLTNATWGGEGCSGVVATDETRKKLSEANKGRKVSEETRKKLSESRKNVIITDETKKKISKANKGENNGNWKGGNIVTSCDCCKKEMVVTRYVFDKNKNHFCSRECMGKYMSFENKGKNNRGYKGYICIYPNGDISEDMGIYELSDLLKVSPSLLCKLSKTNEHYKPKLKRLKHLENIRIFTYEDYLKMQKVS